MRKYLKLMRISHYIKNGLLFLPLIFSGKLLDLNLFLLTCFGFLSFSLASSAIYVINDIFDIEKDKLHPAKCKRPLAADQISVRSAQILAVVLLFISILLNYLTASSNFFAWIFLFVYLLLNLAYSSVLKQIPLLDIAILVSGFLIRILYGASITNIPVSNWLCLTVIAMSFYMGLSKRRNEIIKQGSTSRHVLKYYSYEFLDKNMYLANALTIVFYSLWATDSETMSRLSSNLVWTVPLVMLISMKYSLDIESTSDGDPVEIIFKDKMLLSLAILYMIIVLLVIY